MTQKNVDKIKDKISKLLAKAHGTDNSAEASSFMAKVEELLTAHQLSIGDVVKNDPLERTVLFIAPINPRPWHQEIPQIVAEYYGCKLIAVHQRQATLMVAVGRESTRVTAELMIGFIVEQLREAAKEYRKATNYSMRKSMQDVCDNFVHRLQELIAARNTVAEAHGNTARALVLLDEADAAMKELFPEMTTKAGKQLEINPLARELADKVKIERQVENGNGSTLALAHG
jgi:hypothetical protein